MTSVPNTFPAIRTEALPEGGRKKEKAQQGTCPSHLFYRPGKGKREMKRGSQTTPEEVVQESAFGRKTNLGFKGGKKKEKKERGKVGQLESFLF